MRITSTHLRRLIREELMLLYEVTGEKPERIVWSPDGKMHDGGDGYDRSKMEWQRNQDKKKESALAAAGERSAQAVRRNPYDKTTLAIAFHERQGNELDAVIYNMLWEQFDGDVDATEAFIDEVATPMWRFPKETEKRIKWWKETWRRARAGQNMGSRGGRLSQKSSQQK
jgi:hypothetical protein